MAISKIKPRHASEGRSIAAVLKDRIDYDKNPDKTKGGLLVSSYQCSPDTAWQEFALSKQIYEAETGRKRAPENDVISYLIIQSFKPGEITPEDANKLGYQLALEFTGGQHQFLVATHVDKKHIHCHIEFNSTTLDCTHKFNNYRNTYQTIRKINDRLSREHGLSVIEKPKEKGKHYAEWANERRGTSWKDKLRRTIDRVLPAVSSYEEFLAAMRQEGYEIQTTRKALSFRLASEGQERFTRAKTLGADYTPEAIKERIGQPVKRPRRRAAQLQKNGRVNLLLDIQSRLQGRGPGYERWLKIHNLKEAAKTLNFSTQKTMRLAQQLYEGVDVKGHGTVGLITYLRTDSTRVAEEADVAARAFIRENYGENYVAVGENGKKSNAKIQDAHEAIRPTNISLTPAIVKDSLQRDLFRLYQLIWKRFTASRMQPAVYETTSVKVGAGEYDFTMASSKLSFDGFMSVYVQEEDKEESSAPFGKLEKGMELGLAGLVPSQHFTQPPAHYTEASLVKALEEQGIGRPSTYAPTITTIIARRYVAKENKNLYVTELGEVVNRIMKNSFASIVDINFTANLEYLLDKVGDGNVQWKTVVRNFYPDLEEAVKTAEKELESVTIADEVSDEICENCGRNMVIKYGPHGRFLACPGFPECKNTKPYLEKIGVPCPKCGKDIVIKKTKKGRKYYGCVDNPDCDFMSWQKPSTKKCPECGGMMVEKGNKCLCINENCGYVCAISENK